MKVMDRRRFLRSAALFAVTAPIMGVRAVLAKDHEPLPPVVNGQVLSAKTLNDMTDRINELSAR